MVAFMSDMLTARDPVAGYAGLPPRRPFWLRFRHFLNGLRSPDLTSARAWGFVGPLRQEAGRVFGVWA